MELDDLRRQWQQPPADPPAPLDAAALTQLLARQSEGIVGKLRRSARVELYINFGGKRKCAVGIGTVTR